jgi:hypothetical protein
VLLEGVEVADRRRNRDRREQPDITNLVHVGRIVQGAFAGLGQPLAVVTKEIQQPNPGLERVERLACHPPHPLPAVLIEERGPPHAAECTGGSADITVGPVPIRWMPGSPMMTRLRVEGP